MIDLRQVKTDIKVVLLFSIGLFKKWHDLFSGFLDLGASPYHCDFFVFLLDVVKGMIDFFEWGLPADSEFCHTWFFL